MATEETAAPEGVQAPAAPESETYLVLRLPGYGVPSPVVWMGGQQSDYVWRDPEQLNFKQRRSAMAKLLGWRSERAPDGKAVWSLNGEAGKWPDYTSSLDLVMPLVRALPDGPLDTFTDHLMHRLGTRRRSALFFATPTDIVNALIRTLSPNGIRVRPSLPVRDIVPDDA